MNCTVEEAEVFFKHFKLQKKEGVEMLICPPFTDLTLTNFFLARTSVRWGAQNVYPEEKGAFTGEISPAMLKGLKSGDRIKFDADRVNGQITVTKLQKTK